MMTKPFLLFSLLFLSCLSSKELLNSLPEIATNLVTKLLTDNTKEPDNKAETIENNGVQEAFDWTAWDIFNNILYLMPGYQLYEDEELAQSEYSQPTDKQLRKCVSFYIPSGGEHMFSSCVFHSVEANNYILRIMDTKTGEVTKRMDLYDRRELIYQMPAMKELIKHSLQFIPFWEKKHPSFNMMSDVLQALTHKNKGLHFELLDNPIDNLEAPAFGYRMTFNQLQMGTLNFSLIAATEKEYLDNLSLSANFKIHLTFSIVKDNMPATKQFELPAIASSGDAFNKALNQIEAFLDFKHQFNDSADFEKMVRDYFGMVYKGINITETKNETSDASFLNKNFTLSYEYSTLEMHLGSKINNGHAEYILMIDYPRNNFMNPFVRLVTKRSSQSSLTNLLNQFHANRILKPIMDDIFDMFREGYKSFNDVWVTELKKTNFGELKKTHESPMFGTEHEQLKNKDFKLTYHVDKEKRPKAHVAISSASKHNVFEFTFFMDSYDRKVIDALFVNFFACMEE